MENIEIALFPIPGSVSLPFTRIPLHVFEPRYRKMIRDSIEVKRRVGVAHTQKVISVSKVDLNAPLEKRLSQNHETYQPHPIFSAGFATILETLADGRLMVEIKIDCRYEILEEMQQVPYQIVNCKPYLDDEIDPLTTGSAGPFEGPDQQQLRAQLDEILISIVKNHDPNLTQFLTSSAWTTQSFEEYSFKIFSIVLFAPDVLQKVLELRSSYQRISFLKDILTRQAIQ